MNKKQTPQSERSGALVRKLSSARYWIMMALIALCLMSFKATAFGQVACFDDCQQTMSACLLGAQGDPLSEARCQDRYDGCMEGCLIH